MSHERFLFWVVLVGTIVMLIAGLFGCATVDAPPRVVTEVKTQIVRVSVSKPCEVDVPKRPDSAMPPPAANADDAAMTAGVIADARALRDPGQYLDKIEAALKKCTEGSNQPGGNEP